MKFWYIFIVLSVISNFTFAQKNKLDSAAFESWKTLGDAEISSNGNFVTYTINNNSGYSNKFVLSDIRGKRNLTFEGVNSSHFSHTSNNLIIRNDNDSLGIIDLHTFKVKWIDKVSKMDFLLKDDKEILILTMVERRNDLILQDIEGRYSESFQNVSDYHINNEAGILAVICKSGALDSEACHLYLVDLKTKSRKQILITSKPFNFTFNQDGTQCAYMTEDHNNAKSRKLWMLKLKSNEPRIVLDSSSRYIPAGYYLSKEVIRFNVVSTRLFLSFESNSVRNDANTAPKVYVWSYKDKILQSELKHLKVQTKVLNVCLNINSGRVVELLNSSYEILGDINSAVDFLVVKPKASKPWFKERLSTIRILSLDSGQVLNIAENIDILNGEAYFSPDEKFVVWFDKAQKSFFSFEVSTGQTRNISLLDTKLYDDDAFKRGRLGIWGIAGWMPMQHSILVYDEFDIWMLSLSSNNVPRNLTHNFGRNNNITLNIVQAEHGKQFNINQKVIIAGYNRLTKEGGYWSWTIGKDPNFDLSHMQPYSVNSRKPIGIYWSASGDIKKARSADRYIIIRETATESRNVYFTHDLKTFKRVSDITPERNYEWLTVDLLEWRAYNGNILQGLLYKPDNFDSTIKYPVIINYYEHRSDEYHKFHIPGYSMHNINIPAFTNAGYLVFIPDVSSSLGQNGDGTYNSIESGAQFLSTLRFVDEKKIGLQGHSYGGWQTNYLITRSNRFAAAAEAAGASDLVSSYGQIAYGRGTDRQRFYELYSQGSPYGFNVTPWNNPDLYISNSPIFNIQNIETPLLMMHNKDDFAVPFEQALELFTAMRRSEKKVWLLEYEGGYGHQLSGGAARDYHTRLLQFFDHYLKSSPPPFWMTTGVVNESKSLDEGLRYDLNGLIQ